jgi:serine/threonine-protein phosphatase 2A activator
MASGSADSLAPCKRINDGGDLNFFLASLAYRDIKIWLSQLNRALFPVQDGNNVSTCTLDSPPPYSTVVTSLRSLVQDFENLLSQAPPDTGPRRFGNVAFREWYRLAEEQSLDYGTGHELSFLAFLACLSKIDAFEPGEERAIVVGVVQP